MTFKLKYTLSRWVSGQIGPREEVQTLSLLDYLVIQPYSKSESRLPPGKQQGGMGISRRNAHRLRS